ncbi:helix-turn-helix transcriptional regulator [Streptomyces ipomoeae]|uniref:helix-turn-helix transcriptional regulator n=2 Tax=Streptomyces ipomoeae TaxID=103232 RepID=UPI0029B8D40A|nr:WYL domain-containing protein [Streptomyces ipomoeae]MDX2876927.1 WYL domain-containing protein [Streptomyces ipomoeae]
MRAARLIKMVLLLQSRPSMTATELAHELEVSERTVTRDAQALSEAGVPVYAGRGRAGGYRLIGGYRTRLTGLARSEAEALFLSGVPGALREMGLEDAASAARLKVAAALLPSLRDAPRTAAQRFHLDAPSWFKEPKTPELLPAVAEAVWDDRRIVARYRRDGTEVERELEPYGLVLKAGVWYLCARVPEPAPGTFRTYRIDRFTTVGPATDTGTAADPAAGGARFVRDEEFDLPGFWEEQAERFARSILRTEVVVRISPEGVRRLPYAMDPVSARHALTAATGGACAEDGRTTVTLRVESEEVAYTQLLALGPEVEVLAPEGLRARFAADARRLAELYTAPDATPQAAPGVSERGS